MCKKMLQTTCWNTVTPLSWHEMCKAWTERRGNEFISTFARKVKKKKKENKTYAGVDISMENQCPKKIDTTGRSERVWKIEKTYKAEIVC